MSRKMPKSLYSWLMPKLRRISLIWPGKSIAREQARVQVQTGTFKNGKPKYKIMYKCAECVRQKASIYLHEKEETQMDHINPVVDVKGFKSWDQALPTLFSEPTNYQCLCLPHHAEKTSKENAQRPNYPWKKGKKVNKKYKKLK